MLTILRVQHHGADDDAITALLAHFPNVDSVTVLAKATGVAQTEEE